LQYNQDTRKKNRTIFQQFWKNVSYLQKAAESNFLKFIADYKFVHYAGRKPDICIGRLVRLKFLKINYVVSLRHFAKGLPRLRRIKIAGKDFLQSFAPTAKNRKRENCSRENFFFYKMRYRECHIFSFKFLLAVILVGASLFSVSCSGSKDKHLARGEEYLQKRKFEEALMEFRAAADIDKDSAAAQWGLARSYENLGQYYETVDALQKVGSLNPANLDAKAKLGNYFLLATPPQTDEAQKTLDDIFARDQNFIEGHVLKANILSAQNKPENEILDVLNHAIELNPNRTESYLSLSRYFMKLGKPGDAEKTIQKGISVNAQAASGYIEYGRFLDYANRATEAEAQFKKASEVEPNNIEARESIAQFYIAQKQIDKAEATYQDLVKIQDNSAESRVQLANFYAQVKREDDAIQVFNQIITEKPEYVRARYRLGEIYLDRKEYEKANEQTEALLKLNDDDTQALILRARLRLQENKAEDAIKDLEEILKKQPSHRDSLYLMTQARLALGQIDQARAFIGDLEKYHPNYLKTGLLKIQASLTSGDSENALRMANNLLEAVKNANPSAENSQRDLTELQFRALSARGLAYLDLGKLTEARADLQEILRISPNSSAAMINLAKVVAAEKNLPEALGLYEKALAVDQKNFDALSGSVGILNRQKQFAQAHAKIDKAITENAAQTDVLPALHYLKSDVFTAEKNIESAESELKKAIELDENYLPAYSSYASILVARNQTEQAVEQYKKVVERKPSASIYTLIGVLEDARNNQPEAEKNYRKALEVQPDAVIAANNLAWLIAETGGNLDEALTLSQAVVKKNSSSAGFYDTLGWVYFKKGLYSPAVEQFKKAVALDAKNASAQNPAYRLRLGMALASSGDKLSARREVENSLQNEKSLSQQEAQNAKDLLARL
jgi:tetratricopeptide (TPR) repeat protein